MAHMGPLVSIRDVQPLEAFNVRITFADGTERTIDLEPYLHGPVFEPVRNDPDMFRAIRIEGNTVAWPNGADIDPDVLYYQLTPAWKEPVHRSCCPSDDPQGTILHPGEQSESSY